MGWHWRISQEHCTGCGICADLCPHDAISMPREAPLPKSGPEPCTGCMICVEECPFDAIDVSEASHAPHPENPALKL
ncbi:MAG TPA: 4Fe-4S binding protein [Verrucomicrobiae bacterium]|mgnify:CR=1 FL=1|nr:4Fe-4S binding protein [Verrucomicrobiae bacterium]